MLFKLKSGVAGIRCRLNALIASRLDVAADLPQTRDALDSFITEVLERAKLDVAEDSYRQNIATQIMQLTKDVTKIRRQPFVDQIRRFIANQVAYSLLLDLKAKEKAANETPAE